MEKGSRIANMRRNLFDQWEKSIKTSSSKTAVIHNGESVEYDRLYDSVIGTACYLVERYNIEINVPIAVFMSKSINSVTADLAILAAGCPFVNLDVKTPLDRLINSVKTIRPGIIICDTKSSTLIADIDIPKLIIDEVELQNKDVVLLSSRRAHLIDTDPFCIINTSGSTGTPKGVILNHRSFFDFTDWADEVFGFNGQEIIGSLSPLVFDIYVFELCLMMLHQSTMVVLDATLAMFPAKLLQTLQDSKVSYIFWVPSIMVNIANMDLISKIPLPSLELVWFAGEVFPTKQFLYWYDNLPNACFVNMYGPIEITLDCTFHIIKERPDEDEPLPIGIPCENTDILILDDAGNECTAGEEGELCVRGSSLAMGYYNNKEKTDAAFIQNPLNSAYPEYIYKTGDVVVKDQDGIIHFKGRRDSLIKHMGYRIELGEIEHLIIDNLRIVKYCCAVYNYQEKEIVLFYEKETEISAVDFRKELRRVVPVYMIPSKFIRMDELPRNTNGKIDRMLLKEQVNQ